MHFPALERFSWKGKHDPDLDDFEDMVPLQRTPLVPIMRKKKMEPLPSEIGMHSGPRDILCLV